MSEAVLLTVEEAAARLGFSKSSLNKWRCYGRGPRFLRVGERGIRYRVSDLDAYLAGRTHQGTLEYMNVTPGSDANGEE